MSAKRSSRMAARLHVIFLVAALTASLLVAATRELHVTVARFFLHVDTDGTCVRGLEPGCNLRPIPTVQVSPESLDRLCEAAQNDPSLYVRVWPIAFYRLTCPPIALWADDPNLEWFVFHLVNDLRWSEFGEPRAGIYPGAEAKSRLGEAYAALRHAQALHPDNGGLWIAEAALNFTYGDRFGTLAALREAAARPAWNSGEGAAYRAARDALMELGLPEFEAVLEAGAIREFVRMSLVARAGSGLSSLMAEALRRQDYGEFAELAELNLQLQEPRWRDVAAPNLFARLPWLDNSGLVELLARPFDALNPPATTIDDGSRTYEQRTEARRVGLHYYLNSALADDLLSADANFRHALDARDQECFPWRHFTQSFAAGGMALGCGGILLAMALLRLPIGWRRPATFVVAPTRRPWLRTIGFSLLWLTAGTWVLFQFCDAVNQPIGFGPMPQTAPLLSPSQQSFVGATSLALLLVILRLLAEQKAWVKNVYRITEYLFVWIYLGFIAATAYHRTRAVDMFERHLGS